MIKKDIISIDEIEKEDILEILNMADKLENMSREEKINLLKGYIVSTLFFEPSTRTKMSFESATIGLGANVLSLPPLDQSSFQKGESFSDTIKMIESYSDVIVIRHPQNGSAKEASLISKKPVINAGDGTNQHPTQTLLDLYTILKEKGSINNINIAFVGDLKYGRTVHSLAKALAYFNPNYHFVAPHSLQIPKEILLELDKLNINYYLHENYEECIKEIDVFYMTRIQKERFESEKEYNKVKSCYILKKNNLENICKDDMIVLHPLPRVDEIDISVDETKYAKYFEQAKNGIPIRQAILLKVLNINL